MRIGIFEVEQLNTYRFRVMNTLTEIPHVTYGPEAEVIEQLEVQSCIWEAKFAAEKAKVKRKRGDAFRRRNTADIAEMKHDAEVKAEKAAVSP